MKTLFLLILSLLIIQNVSAQNIEFNRTYFSKGSDFSQGLTCSKGCYSIYSFESQSVMQLSSSLSKLFVYNHSTVGDTFQKSYVGSFEYSNHDLVYEDENFLLFRALEVVSRNFPVTFGDAIFRKFRKSDGSLVWQRRLQLPLPSENCFGSIGIGNIPLGNGTAIHVALRSDYPTIGIGSHPFVQIIDSSGLILSTNDYFNTNNTHSGGGNISKLPNGNYFISQTERFFNGRLWCYGLWLDGNTHAVYKKKYVDYNLSTGPHIFNILPVKPDKYIVNIRGYGSSFQFFRDTLTFLTDSSLSLANATWVKRGKYFDFGTAMEDGSVTTVVGKGNKVFVENLNMLNGQVNWSRNFEPNGFDLYGNELVKADFDDSSNLYISGIGTFNNIYAQDNWLAKLSNVGQPWDPWNTNLQGLSNENKPLSLFAYPNPTSGRFRLRGYKEEEGLTLRIFSNSGKEVWRGVPSPEGEVDISQLSPGLYQVEALTTSGKRWSTRVVRE